MEINNIKSLNINSDKWKINYKSSLGDIVTFDFTYLPNNWFKKTQKEITIECLTIGKPSLMTLYRYNYSLKRFFEFLIEYGFQLKTFEDLQHQHTQMFLFYLKQQNISKSTMVISLSALKWLVGSTSIFWTHKS